MNSNQFKGYMQVFMAGLLWGTIGIWATLLGNMGMNSMMTAFFRLLSASIILFIILLIKGNGFRLFKISKRGLLSCALIGFLSQALYNYCYMYAVQNVGMSTAAVLLYSSPIFVALLSKIILKESMTSNKIIAIIINILGCILTVTGGSFAGVSINIIGIGMGVMAGFTYALLPILGRVGADREDPFTSAFYGMTFGGLLLLFLAHPYSGMNFTFSLNIVLVLIAYGLIPTAMGYIIYFGGLSKITETSKVPVICSVENVAASVFGFLLFHEAFNTVKIAGIALVFCSVLIMNLKKA